MDDRDGWENKVREIRACSVTFPSLLFFHAFFFLSFFLSFFCLFDPFFSFVYVSSKWFQLTDISMTSILHHDERYHIKLVDKAEVLFNPRKTL